MTQTEARQFVATAKDELYLKNVNILDTRALWLALSTAMRDNVSDDLLDAVWIARDCDASQRKARKVSI